MSKREKDREQPPPSETDEPPDKVAIAMVPKIMEAASGLVRSSGALRRTEWRSHYCVLFD